MKRIFALTLAVLLLAGCAGPGGSRSNSGNGGESRLCDLQPAEDPAFLSCALAQPVYPEFPRQPRLTEEGWDSYSEAYDRYMDALLALRGEDPNLSQEEHAALTAFAARSTPW